MIIIYYLDLDSLNLNGFKDANKDDFPEYLYSGLYKTLFNITEQRDGRLLYNEERHLFALVGDGVCIVEEDGEDEFIEEFMEDLLFGAD